MECTIDPSGVVQEVRAIKGVPPLTDAAIKAVKKWRYTTTLLNGVAAPVIMTVTVNFTRDLRFRLPDLLDSLKSKNEFIRESAVRWLASARGNLDPRDRATVVHELERAAQREANDTVKTAIAQALVQLKGK